jgi:threonine dehydrogenase-like Zn-dependent dehydrogenase
MRAVVRRNKQLVCAEIEDLTPGPGQVLAKTLCCGICGSDLHALHSFEHMLELGQRSGGGGVGGGIDPSADIVFGHEFCAEILDHGPGSAKTLKAGTRVVTVPVMMTATGVDTIGYSNRYPGGFAERMLLSEPLLLEVPNGLSATQAAMTEPFAVGEHAVAQSAAGPDAALLVVGCGPVGLAVIAALKSRGLGPIVAADFSPARRALAEVMGADEVIDPAVQSPHVGWSARGVPTTFAERAMAQMNGTGKRAVVFECVGVPGVLQSIVEGVPGGAQIIVAGVCMATDSIEPSLCINKQLDFRFVLGYSPQEFAATLHNIAEGRIDVRPAITDTVGLQGVAGAFAALADPERQCKIVVDPSI